MYVCGMYLYVFCIYTSVHVCVYIDGRSWYQVSSLIVSHLIFFETGYLPGALSYLEKLAIKPKYLSVSSVSDRSHTQTYAEILAGLIL